MRYYEGVETRYLTVAYNMAGNKEWRQERNPNTGEATGIRAAQEPTTHDGNTYDLQGRRIHAKPNRGIYIKGGKKHAVSR